MGEVECEGKFNLNFKLQSRRRRTRGETEQMDLIVPLQMENGGSKEHALVVRVRYDKPGSGGAGTEAGVSKDGAQHREMQAYSVCIARRG